MSRRLPSAKQPLLDRQLDMLRYAYASARHAPIRGTRMRLGAGAHLIIGQDARIHVAPGFIARRDLTLVVLGTLEIGADLFCNRGIVLAAMDRIQIGDSVRIGERTSIIDHNHVVEPVGDTEARFHRYETSPITIGDRVLISANCTILAGSQIGEDSVIAAGSVVRGSIPPRVIAAGVPATVKRSLRD
jgi:acetyltransferase-like isoleucine patch superfamily enzyme